MAARRKIMSQFEHSDFYFSDYRRRYEFWLPMNTFNKAFLTSDIERADKEFSEERARDEADGYPIWGPRVDTLHSVSASLDRMQFCTDVSPE